jgi:hypothetical protein
MSYVIINGFDRSGTSAISRCIAAHPDVELIMQPFNSGSIRQKMNITLNSDTASIADKDFFTGLAANKISEKYIQSEWYYKHSTSRSNIPGKLPVVKTTINHMAQKWMVDNFPSLDVWGIWRDPYANLNSILVNEFHSQWYEGAFAELKGVVNKSNLLAPIFSDFYKDDLEVEQQLALIYSTRSYFFFYYLNRDKLINYEDFTKNANTSINKFLEYYQLGAIDLKDVARRDLNIIGKKSCSDAIGQELKSDAKIEQILTPTFQLLKEKFQI